MKTIKGNIFKVKNDKSVDRYSKFILKKKYTHDYIPFNCQNLTYKKITNNIIDSDIKLIFKIQNGEIRLFATEGLIACISK